MAANQRAGRNSVAKLVSLAASAATEKIPLPEGVILRDEAEMVIWHQFTRARTRDDWRDFDLILVAKAVRLEADIRKHQQMLDRTGVIIKNKRDTPIPNPLIAIIDMLQRQQLAIVRSLSMNQGVGDPRTRNLTGLAASRYGAMAQGAVDDLLA